MIPDLNQLEELARRATPGPYEATEIYCSDDVEMMDLDVTAPTGAWWVTGYEWVDLEDDGLYYNGPDAAFAVAANPQTILSLIRRIQELEAWIGSQM